MAASLTNVQESAFTTAARRLRFDPVFGLLAPATLFLLLAFVYPFVYGFLLSFRPPQGGWLYNYRLFFSSDRLWPTILTTLKLALPATLINLGLALPLAYRLRVKSRYQKWITAVIRIPTTCG